MPLVVRVVFLICPRCCFLQLGLPPTRRRSCGSTSCRSGRTSTWTSVSLYCKLNKLCVFTSNSRTLLCPFSSSGSTYPNGLAAGSINASGGTKNPLATGASNKSSTVSVKSPSPVPSAPSAKDDDYDFDSMQVNSIVNILTFLWKYIREA